MKIATNLTILKLKGFLNAPLIASAVPTDPSRSSLLAAPKSLHHSNPPCFCFNNLLWLPVQVDQGMVVSTTVNVAGSQEGTKRGFGK